jgi:SNF2 family DNA or RNA helicase
MDFMTPQKPLLRSPKALWDYQREATLHQLYNKDSMLWLGMGLGKTAITLTTIVEHMKANRVKKVLIFGPLRVIQSVWATEARKWEHTDNLTFSILTGTPEKRSRALFSEADIYLCNYENMNWLARELDHYYLSQGHELPFEMVVYDEVSKLKNTGTKRVAGGKTDMVDGQGREYTVIKVGWRKIMNHFEYRTGLTGTPASNGYLDLFGQYLAVDGGQRLGEFVTHYKDAYFTSDHSGWKYTPTVLGQEFIEARISDITLKMDARDYLDLPDSREVNIMVDLPPKARKYYKEVEKQLFCELESGSTIELFSKTSVSNKLLQMCNGQPYVNQEVTTGEFDVLHNAKLDALAEVLEEINGPVLCSYSFVSDAKRIMDKFKKYKPINLTEAPAHSTRKIIDRWNNGEIKLLIGHPASMGHGIDGLQEGGCTVVWFGINWSLELYEQMNARIDRQGQTSPTSIIRILCNDTVDLAVADAIARKTDDQEGLKAAMQRYVDGTTTNDLVVDYM